MNTMPGSMLSTTWLTLVALIALSLTRADLVHREQSGGSQFSKCGFSSDTNFVTWYEQLFTNSPVLFPKTDEELAYICSTAKANGCKVRVRGAGHSEDGLVMQKLDELDYEVVVVHLKDYVPSDSSWNGVLDKDTDTVKVPAGWSTLQLMALIRPQGYLTKTNTAGRFFSVGGAYLNPSVIGSIQKESRYAAQVQSVRVMNADGIITEYSGDDVIDFRGSAGLLGIVTAMEISVVEDQGLTMTRSTFDVHPFDEDKLRQFFVQEYSLHDGIQFFYYVYEDAIEALEIDYTGGSPIDPATTVDYYSERLAKHPDLSFEGASTTGVVEISEALAGVIESKRTVAQLVSRLSRINTNNQFNTAAQSPRDGYFLEIENLPRYQGLGLSIKCSTDCLDETIKVFKISRSFLKQFENKHNSDWYPYLPLEWRLFSAQENEMTLEHLAKGKYIVLELPTLRVGSDGLEFSKYFDQIEELWLGAYPDGRIHHGKAWGMDDVPGFGSPGDKVQFQDVILLNSIYSPDVRKAFVDKMKKYDPSGTFAAGSFLTQLGLTTNKLTPKQYVGDSCGRFEDGECISGCCDTTRVFSHNKQCLATDLPEDNRCIEDCQCPNSQECRSGFWPWQWRKQCRM